MPRRRMGVGVVHKNVQTAMVVSARREVHATGDRSTAIGSSGTPLHLSPPPPDTHHVDPYGQVTLQTPGTGECTREYPTRRDGASRGMGWHRAWMWGWGGWEPGDHERWETAVREGSGERVRSRGNGRKVCAGGRGVSVRAPLPPGVGGQGRGSRDGALIKWQSEDPSGLRNREPFRNSPPFQTEQGPYLVC